MSDHPRRDLAGTRVGARGTRGSHRPARPAPTEKPKVPQCRAIYRYKAVNKDELDLEVGDIVMIIKKGTRGRPSCLPHRRSVHVHV